MIPLLLPAPYGVLTRRLDAAVAQDASLAPARAKLLLPLQLLEAMAREAEGALGNDPLATERLRLLVSVSAPHAVPSSAASALSAQADGQQVTPPAGAVAPGILHVGALVIVGLAAGRAGATVNMGAQFVRTVLGLALAAGPAESLVQLAGPGLTDEQLGVLLRALVTADQGSSMTAALAAFVSDPSQRARWERVTFLLNIAARQADATTWDGAISRGVLALDPAAACPGQKITLRTDLPREVMDELAAHGGKVVFVSGSSGALQTADATVPPPEPIPNFAQGPAAQDGQAPQNPQRPQKPQRERKVQRPVQVAEVSFLDPRGSRIEAVVPQGAQPGWVGLDLPSARNRSNEDRRNLRDFWKQQSASSPGLAGMPVPVDAIGTLPDPAAPQPGPGNRYFGGLPVVRLAALQPSVVDPGGALVLSWATDFATQVRLEPGGQALEAEGTLSLTAPRDAEQVAMDVVAVNPCGEVRGTAASRVRVRITSVELKQGGRATFVEGEPVAVQVRFEPTEARPSGALVVSGFRLEGQQENGGEFMLPVIDFEIPGGMVRDGLTGTLTLAPGVESEPDDSRDIGPLEVVTPRVQKLIVMRPAVFSPEFTRVSDSELEEAIAQAESALGVTLDWQEPAWIDDDVLTVGGTVDSCDSPFVSQLLDRLSRLAAAQPGLEDAVWVAVLPRFTSTSQGGGELVIQARPEALSRAPALGDAIFEVAVARRVGAEAAQAVAVATPELLAEVLREPPADEPAASVFSPVQGGARAVPVSELPAAPAGIPTCARGQPASQSAMTRLRLVGTLSQTGKLVLHQGTRTEIRAVGPGAEIDTGVDAVAVDPDGNDLVVRRLMGVRPGWPMTWVALLPVAEQVAAVEIRAGRRVLGRLDRLGSSPVVSDIESEGEQVSWSYDHPGGAPPRLSVELGRGGGWCPVVFPAPCDRDATLPLGRLVRPPEGSVSMVRVVASDGWNSASSVLFTQVPFPRIHVAARAGGGNRFWADTDGAQPQWTLGERTFDGFAIQLSDEDRGTLTLTVTDGEERFTDVRQVGSANAGA